MSAAQLKKDGAMSFLTSAFLGAAVAFGTTVVGSFVGSALERPVGGPVVAWEMVPLVVGVCATVGGAFVGPLATWGGTWRRGLMLGAGLHSLIFGALLIPTIGSNPRAVLCWSTTTGILAGAIAGALCGALRSSGLKKSAANLSNGDNGKPASVC